MLKEICTACPTLDAYHIMLMPPNANDVLSKGNQIHIKASIDQENLSCIKPILEKHNLAMVQEKDMLVIFKPLKD